MNTSGPLGRRSFLLGATAFAAALATGCGDGGSSDTAEPTSTTDAPAGTTPPTSDAPTRAVTAPESTGFVVRGAPDTDAVALTFHTDGDLGLARQLLDVLVANGAVATSFVVGDWLGANPTWADELSDAGLELANHTYTHPTFSRLSDAQMADEIGRCRDVLIELTGEPGRLFRPSGTSDGTSPPSAQVLAAADAAGYTTVLGWDVEPFDYEDPGAGAVADRVLSTVTGGSVVSLHFGHPGTVDALDPILTGLDERGLRTVTASELLTLP